MAFTYGFYNSKNKDRRYNADQMSQLFDGILNDGVFNKVGELMMVVPGTGLQVLVKSGRAWFNSTWSYNDAAYPLNLSTPDVTVPRIDAVVLEVDHTETVRRNRLLVVKGIASSTPEKPTLTNTDLIHQHPLAYVKLQPGAQSISAGDIEIMVGKDECPFVTGILETASLEDLFASWDEQFTTWFEDIQSQLEGDVAANLLNQINERVKIADLASQSQAESGSDNTKWMSPLRTKQAISKHPDVGKIKFGSSYATTFQFANFNMAKKLYYFDDFRISPNKQYMLLRRESGQTPELRLIKTSDMSVVWSKHTITPNNSSSTMAIYMSDSMFIWFVTSGTSTTFSIYNYNSSGATQVVNNVSIPGTAYAFINGCLQTTYWETNYTVLYGLVLTNFDRHYYNLVKIDLSNGSVTTVKSSIDPNTNLSKSISWMMPGPSNTHALYNRRYYDSSQRLTSELVRLTFSSGAISTVESAIDNTQREERINPFVSGTHLYLYRKIGATGTIYYEKYIINSSRKQSSRTISNFPTNSIGSYLTAIDNKAYAYNNFYDYVSSISTGSFSKSSTTDYVYEYSSTYRGLKDLSYDNNGDTAYGAFIGFKSSDGRNENSDLFRYSKSAYPIIGAVNIGSEAVFDRHMYIVPAFET